MISARASSLSYPIATPLTFSAPCVFFAQGNANLPRMHAQNDAFGHPTSLLASPYLPPIMSVLLRCVVDIALDIALDPGRRRAEAQVRATGVQRPKPTRGGLGRYPRRRRQPTIYLYIGFSIRLARRCAPLAHTGTTHWRTRHTRQQQTYRSSSGSKPQLLAQ